MSTFGTIVTLLTSSFFLIGGIWSLIEDRDVGVVECVLVLGLAISATSAAGALLS